MKVVALAGGTGSAKLLRGLQRLPINLTVIANVGDNAWMYGVYVCPDIDISCYTLAGIADPSRGWGIAGDTFEALAAFSRYGLETWFKLGDRDLATCTARTALMRAGSSLTEATEVIRKGLGVKPPVLPSCDEHVQTAISTSKGELDLQYFWVREKGSPTVKGVRYVGAGNARPTKRVRDALRAADRVVICPANPVTSVGPMLAIPGFVRLLKLAPRVVALSPMMGNAPFSGPAGKLMKAADLEPDSLGVARLYSRFLDSLVISSKDGALQERIRALGIDCTTSNTLIEGPDDELRLAKELLA